MPITPPPPPAHAIAASAVSAEHALLREMNRVRRSHGLPRLRLTRSLQRTARAQSRTIFAAGSLTHSSVTGRSFAARMSRTRYRAVAENLAWTSSGAPHSARAVVRMWLKSPGHRANLLNGSFRRVGVDRRAGTLRGLAGFAVAADFASAR